LMALAFVERVGFSVISVFLPNGVYLAK